MYGENDKKNCILRSRKTKTRKSKTLQQVYSLSSKKKRKYYYLDKLKPECVRGAPGGKCVLSLLERERVAKVPPVISVYFCSPPPGSVRTRSLLCNRIFFFLLCNLRTYRVRTTANKQNNGNRFLIFVFSLNRVD